MRSGRLRTRPARPDEIAGLRRHRSQCPVRSPCRPVPPHSVQHGPAPRTRRARRRRTRRAHAARAHTRLRESSDRRSDGADPESAAADPTLLDSILRGFPAAEGVSDGPPRSPSWAKKEAWREKLLPPRPPTWTSRSTRSRTSVSSPEPPTRDAAWQQIALLEGADASR